MMKTFDIVGTIHGLEYSEHGEYVAVEDYRELELANEVLRKAAEKYWWVREQSRNESGIRIVHPFGKVTGFRNMIDDAVAEEMNKK